MGIYGLLGEKLEHSMSPEIHDKIFSHMGIDGEYRLFAVGKEDIHEIADKIRTGKIKGINVTIPYKLEIMKYLDVVSKEAEHIGAVNTVCMKDNKLTGYNTDCFGFENTLIINGIDVQRKNAAVLGTGGASKAIVYVLGKMGAGNIDLFSRAPTDSQKGYDNFNANHDYDLIINTTPVGMHPNEGISPIKKEAIGNAAAVVDIIYNPIKTKLLAYAEQLGAKHVNGMYMLVAQAVKAQEIFNSIKIDNAITEKIYNNITGGI